jgi:hypothetical protein
MERRDGKGFSIKESEEDVEGFEISDTGEGARVFGLNVLKVE